MVNVGPSLLSAASFHKLLIPGLMEIEITYACNNYVQANNTKLLQQSLALICLLVCNKLIGELGRNVCLSNLLVKTVVHDRQ